MKRVLIITHCYAVVLPQYAACLRYQLAGLRLHPPEKCEFTVVVCMEPSDRETTEVCTSFPGTWRYPMALDMLGRRCIGRNLACIEYANYSDYVIFTDADYIWRGSALDTLVKLTWPYVECGNPHCWLKASMVFPRTIQVSRNHATGDRIWSCAGIDIDPTDFIPQHFNRAIGGVQIVRGDFARRYGYLNDNPKWQQPRTDGKPFADFRDDVAYRKFCLLHGPIVPIELPGIYRIRHSETTYQ